MKVHVYLLILCVLAPTLQIKAGDYGDSASDGYSGLVNFGGGYGQGYGGITGGGHDISPPVGGHPIGPGVGPPLNHGPGPYATFCLGKSGLLAHPVDCCSFIDCDHGGLEGLCSPGTVFSILSSGCDYVANSKCVKGTSKHCAKKALKKWGR